MTTKTRKHGLANVAKRSKWCAECSQWIAFSQWPKHTVSHKIPTSLMDQVNKVYKQLNETGKPIWRAQESDSAANYQFLYEEIAKKLQKEEMQSLKLRKENSQLRRVICEQARVIVETYSEYS